MKAQIYTLLVILGSITAASSLAVLFSGCSSNEDHDAEVPYACKEGVSISPNKGECLRITGRFRLGGMSRGACHDVWDELTDATISSEMLISGDYEVSSVACEE